MILVFIIKNLVLATTAIHVDCDRLLRFALGAGRHDDIHDILDFHNDGWSDIVQLRSDWHKLHDPHNA